MDSGMLTTVIASLTSAGVLTALIDWFRNRHKVASEVKLTDVQTLQAQLAYIEGVAEYLRKHNDDLQNDYTQLEDKYRKQRERISELEEEIRKVRQSAHQTQIECEQLGKRLEQLLGDDTE